MSVTAVLPAVEKFMSAIFYDVMAMDDAFLVDGLDEKISAYVMRAVQVNPDLRSTFAKATVYRQQNPGPATLRREPTSVYFIQSASGAIKIGCASSPEKRRLELQTGSPENLRLVATHAGGRSIEHALHDRFACDRLRGEWFSPSPALLHYIAEVNK